MFLKKYKTLQIIPIGKRDKKIEEEFQSEIENVFRKYRGYSMCAIQNCEISKVEIKENTLMYLPDKNAYFVFTFNAFKV